MTRHPYLLAAALLATPALLLACGDDGGSGNQAAATELTIVIGTATEPSIATAALSVTADGAASGTGYLTSPDAAAEAAALLRNADAVTRLTEGAPTDRACSEIYGGPDVGVVTGTVAGIKIETRFDRSDGCGIADWQLFEPLLGRPRWSGDQRIYFRDETEIAATVGSEFLIELASNPTTGYSWRSDVAEGAPVEVGESTYIAPDTDLVGAGGYEQFRLRATAVGTAVVVFAYVRSFEPDSPPVDTVTFTVTVAD